MYFGFRGRSGKSARSDPFDSVLVAVGINPSVTAVEHLLHTAV
jgi:hypothetical protein